MRSTKASKANWLVLCSVFPMLAACGGDGVNSAPPPAGAPTGNTPTPTAFQPVEAKLLPSPPESGSLVAMGEGWQGETTILDPGFDVTVDVRDADNVSIEYDSAKGGYVLHLPDGVSGTVYQSSVAIKRPNPKYQGKAYFSAMIGDQPPEKATSGPLLVLQPGSDGNPYRYVTHAWWDVGSGGSNGQWYHNEGVFGFAIPTVAGDVPVTGSATYNADVIGVVEGAGHEIGGAGRFDFDFASGALAGLLELNPICGLNCGYAGASYTDTSFARGATSFSGKLKSSTVSGLGEFSGIFAGPGAAELLARFETPIFNNAQQEVTVAGVILGKKN